MTSKKYLSNKKNVKMSFSTSDALTDWIKRYVSKKKKEDPNDRRYNSISSFIHCSLDKIMQLFEKGKTLNDFDNVVDEDLKNFYDQITFKALIPQFEASVEMNKFIPLKNQLLRFYKLYRLFIFSQMNTKDSIEENLFRIVERFDNFVKKNKVTKQLLMTIDRKKIIFEYEGKEKNLHFELSKSFAAIIGSVGGRILEVSYLPNYTRFDCEFDSIINQKIPNIKEQIALSKENVEKLLKYEYLLNDKKEHLWLNTSLSKSALISFKSIKSGINFINSKLDLLKKTIKLREIPKYCLRIFEKFNWITIDNEESLSFRFTITETEHKIERTIVKEIFKDKLKFIDENSYYVIRANT